MTVALAPLDLEALLVALVLDPATYSRNRFFHLYADAAARRVRRRAALVRSIIRHVATQDDRRRGEIVEARPIGDGWVEVSYTVPALGLRRTTQLEAMEVCLVRFAVARLVAQRSIPASSGGAGSTASAADDADRVRIEAALRRLAHPVIDGPLGAEPGTGTGA